MLTEQDYQFLWFIYVATVFVLMLLLWLPTRRFKSSVFAKNCLRYLCLSSFAAMLLLPWRVEGAENHLAPGLAVWLMSFFE